MELDFITDSLLVCCHADLLIGDGERYFVAINISKLNSNVYNVSFACCGKEAGFILKIINELKLKPVEDENLSRSLFRSFESGTNLQSENRKQINEYIRNIKSSGDYFTSEKRIALEKVNYLANCFHFNGKDVFDGEKAITILKSFNNGDIPASVKLEEMIQKGYFSDLNEKSAQIAENTVKVMIRQFLELKGINFRFKSMKLKQKYKNSLSYGGKIFIEKDDNSLWEIGFPYEEINNHPELLMKLLVKPEISNIGLIYCYEIKKKLGTFERFSDFLKGREDAGR